MTIPPLQDNSTVSCVDLNSTLSWTLPPDLLVDIDLEDMVEGEVSTAVVGASVTVGWQEVTEVAATVLPMDSSIDLGMVTASIFEVT